MKDPRVYYPTEENGLVFLPASTVVYERWVYAFDAARKLVVLGPKCPKEVFVYTAESRRTAHYFQLKEPEDESIGTMPDRHRVVLLDPARVLSVSPVDIDKLLLVKMENKFLFKDLLQSRPKFDPRPQFTETLSKIPRGKKGDF